MDFPTGAHRRESCRRMYEIADYWLNDFRDELDRRADEKGVLRWRPSWPNPFDRTRPFLDQEGRTLEALEQHLDPGHDRSGRRQGASSGAGT